MIIIIYPILKEINKELHSVFKKINEDSVEEVLSYILKAPQMFVAGVGRSGYMMRAFAMRLMHAKLNAFVIGDTETPGAKKGDLLILGSGSGETESLKAYASKAKKLGLNIITITSFPDSTLGKISNVRLHIPAPTPKSKKTSKQVSIQPMANLFEQSLLIFSDALSMKVMEAKNLNSNEMFSRHANLE
ncbi:6-phospho-3-hexuloisomerase [Halocella sp. SP3-1]|uniref:6-phospho-3-hexuloisomerase n=1 Tax=Halocella sp. SP3-1 TaxID=2382161 RepID=UPI00197AC0A2|nr:6-phospho-3-hexuloisomerase [Halocella sp. SP3-1]